MRIHGHAGFSAVQHGLIDRSGYIALLGRLLGFYQMFEPAAGLPSTRSAWLKDDLADLDCLQSDIAAFPACPDRLQLNTPARRLGALYVIEGSALGGRELAKGLDGLLGTGAIAGRRFFTGRGAQTGETWRQLLATLEGMSNDIALRREVVETAASTFEAFEQWLNRWQKDANCG